MNSPTLTAQATAAGIMLGTAAYMAPNRRAGSVDKRADVWAFGVRAVRDAHGPPPVSG